jgi:hypothetical protein
VLQLHKHEEHVFVSRVPSSTCTAVLARCAELAPLRMHTHGLRPDMHDAYFLKLSML